MQIEPSHWERIQQLFHDALELDSAQRSAWLNAQCTNDTALLGEVQSLLIAYEEQERFVAQPSEASTVLVRPTSSGEQASSSEGTDPLRFGPYAVVRKIGEGGMGAVYLADRADGQFEQRVAIKVGARQAHGELFLQSFRAERQILASLNYPGIARLLDGGAADDGALYLAMEYVEGTPIDSYCNEHSLSLPERLRLFQSICLAVQYAHRNLVIHRDLKPDNILVQADGSAKLLDFGTAKLISPAAEIAESALTSAGFHAYTPAYASPEQILGNPVTTASDVYSLGVILYRLLTGRPPYELKDYRTAELIAVVCESEPEPTALNPELNAILLKCLRKTPEDRYRSVDELHDDISFYLQGRPVLARHASTRYRAWKFIKRNNVGAGVAMLLAATIVLGVAGILWQARIARSRYNDLLVTDRFLAELIQLIQSDLLEAYLKMGNLQGNPYEQNLGDSPGGMATLQKALAISQRLVSQQPSDAHAIRINAFLRQSIGDVHYGMGQAKEAIEMGTAAATMLEGLAGPKAPANVIMEAAVSHETLGDEYGQSGRGSMGDQKSALAEYQKALALVERALSVDPSYFRARRGIAMIQFKIGGQQLEADPQVALTSFLTAIRTFDALPEKETATLGNRRVRSNFLRKAGDAYEALEDWDAALAYYTKCLRMAESFAIVDPDDHRAQFELAIVLNHISIIQQAKGDRQAAYETSDRVRAALEGLLRRDPQNSIWRGHLSDVQLRMLGILRAKGAAAEAERLRSSAMAAVRALASRPDASVLDLCRAGGAMVETEPELAAGYAEKCVEGTGYRSPNAFIQLVAARRALGRWEEARQAAKEGLALLPPSSGRPGTTRRQLEELLN